MSADILAMHKAFLAQVIERRGALQSQLVQLDAVESYHRKIIDELESHRNNGQAAQQRPAGGKQVREITDMRLIHASRHDACAVALKELGGKAKTQDVADWLLEHGYGQEFEPRIFHNTCYTAMKRKEDMFEKVGPGEWELVK